MLDLTPFLKLYAIRRRQQLRLEDSVVRQERELLTLISFAEHTRFGRDHSFGSIRSVAEFQKSVPLRRYEDFWRDYWEPEFPRLVDCTWPDRVPFFALTSGTTTGVTKHIPCTQAMNAANLKAAADILVHHLSSRPDTRILAGLNFMLGGSTDLRELAPGIVAGDLSGIAAKTAPWWARLRYFPPRELETITDWEVKIERLAAASLEKDIRSISGTPSWLLLFFDRLAALRTGRDRKLCTYYPNLELVILGAVSFAPYRRSSEKILR